MIVNVLSAVLMIVNEYTSCPDPLPASGADPPTQSVSIE